ncbi:MULTISPECIES: hypothetical protein [unclassified Rathayibacter]|uniref:hypothetical protein n=1 Tax=unclassified Rathayibacter TaxID=2609250 RepID=UPI00142319C9|nr:MULTISPECIES: hypothetical protein [unclassified Rathayibacter]MCJ1683940.1 hypothetical protein [Rathayibacter sp. VKM Ac-2928]MCJ1686732.1 hypothetical protein [Rathayibacter sp. VKM Ac-2927]
MSDDSTPDTGTPEEGGLGTEGTIPDSEDGIALGVSGDSHFNPEEDAPSDSEGEADEK